MSPLGRVRGLLLSAAADVSDEGAGIFDEAVFRFCLRTVSSRAHRSQIRQNGFRSESKS